MERHVRAIIQRVRHPALSLWQSSAMAAAHIQLSLTKPPGVISTQDLLSHSLVRAASDHARGAVAGTPVAGPPLERSTPDSAYLSSLYFNLAMARATKDTVREQSLAQETRKYSTADTAGWETCGSNFAYYLSLDGGRIYNSWQGKDKGLQFSVIDYRLPNDAVVAVLGDWGTGMDDAAQLLKTVLRQHHPHAIIHLGDIYYSGTPQGTQDAPDYRGECRNNFLQVLTETFNEVLGLGQRVPVFTIPGNHEYYCMGVGYYTEVRPQVNQGLPDAYQPASFFCLRTQDDLWQFLGMDTGYNDYNPLYLFDPVDAAPSLQPNEATWHIDKLDNFTGKTILLSHHQLFSANVKLNGGETLCQANINNGLQALFAPYLSNHVAAWLWGHEHNLVLYQNGLLGLRRARLIGASSYEETTGESPYQVNYPDIPYLDPANFQLEAQNGYYNHSYAVIEFKRAQPDDPIKISYYQYPSWGGSNDIPPQTATLMFTEPLEVTKPPVGVPIAYSRPLFMQLSGYGYLGARVIDYRLGGPYDFPTLSPGAPVPLALQGGGGPISDGDTVQIFSLERPLEASASALGAWDIPALYYYGGFGSPNQQWTVHKRDTSVDKIIRFEDELSFTNQQYADQGLCPLQVEKGMYLTTRQSANAFWRCQLSRIRTDYTVWRPTDGTWYVKASRDGTVVSQPWGQPEDIPVPGDYDGDGLTDYAVWRASEGTWYVMHRWDGSTVTKQWGQQPDIPVPGDYDGDGKTDYAVWRSTDATWCVSSDGGIVTQQWGQKADTPLSGDYDGDGKTDFTVWRPENGTWYVIRSSDGAIVTQQLGEQGDIPLSGDYDGDGKTDFTVWRPENGIWYVIRSSDGAIVTQQLGERGDIPLPGDFDGDGKTDFTVYRPATGQWHVIRSSDGTTVTQPWGQAGDMPVTPNMILPRFRGNATTV